MKRKTVALMTALTLAISLSACGSTPTASSNPDSTKMEELEQRIEELEAENKELKTQIEDSDSAEESQQIGNEAESLMKATIESPETSGVCGADLTWYYQNGILVITGKGEMTDYNEKGSPWYDIRDKIGWVIIDEGITTIGDNAYNNLSVLSNVVLPSTLAHIGKNAFYECSNLQKITLPNELISIKEGAFIKCNIKELTFPSTLENIGGNIFWNGDGYNEPITYVDTLAFMGNAPKGIEDLIWWRCVGFTKDTEEQWSEEERLKAEGRVWLNPMTIYYSGDTFDEFISSYPYWDEFNVKWIKQ